MDWYVVGHEVVLKLWIDWAYILECFINNHLDWLNFLFLTFPACFSIPKIFFNLNFNCSNLSILRNLQEQVKKAFCYQKLFWPFTVWINYSSNLKNLANSRPSALNFKSFSRSLKQLFLTVGQNNFGNKILFPIFILPKVGDAKTYLVDFRHVQRDMILKAMRSMSRRLIRRII